MTHDLIHSFQTMPIVHATRKWHHFAIAPILREYPVHEEASGTQDLRRSVYVRLTDICPVAGAPSAFRLPTDESVLSPGFERNLLGDECAFAD